MENDGKYQIGFTDETPHTIEGAKPTEFQEVQKKKVIHVLNAYYRNSKFSGTFELIEQQRIPFIRSKKGKRVEVHCYWFGCRPTTIWPQILIENADYEIEENYDGPVARNISLPL